MISCLNAWTNVEITNESSEQSLETPGVLHLQIDLQNVPPTILIFLLVHDHVLSQAVCDVCYCIYGRIFECFHKARPLSLNLISRLLFQGSLQKAGHLAVGPMHTLCQIQGLFLAQTHHLLEQAGWKWHEETKFHVFPQGMVRNFYLMFVMLHTPSTVVIVTSGLVTSRTTSTRVAAWVRWVLLSATLNWGKHVRNLKVSCLSGLDLNVAICMTDEAAMLISPLCHLVLSYEFRCCICLSKEALVFAWLCWNASVLMWNMDKRSLINSNLF